MSTKLYDITDWCRKGTELEDYPYIGEVDIDMSIGQVVQVGEKYYVPGVRDCKNNSVGIRQMDINLEPEDMDYERNLTCPYCGYEDEDSWELSDDDDEHECGRCGATMSYQRNVTVEYNSSPKAPPEIVKANWIGKKL